MAAANHPIKLTVRPDLESQARPRAERLGLTVSGLVGALVWNDSVQRNARLKPVDAPERVSRVEITVTLRRPLRTLATRQAKLQVMSLNAYLEALLAEDLREPFLPLTIQARRG